MRTTTVACALFAGALFFLALPAEARPRVTLLEPTDGGFGAVRLTAPQEDTGSATSDVGLRVAHLEPGSLYASGLLAAVEPSGGGEVAPRGDPAVAAGIALTVSTLVGGLAGGLLLGFAGASVGGQFLGPLLAILGAIFGIVAGMAVGALIGGLIAAAIAVTNQVSQPAATPETPRGPTPAPTPPGGQEPSISITPLIGSTMDGHGLLMNGLTVRF